MKLLLAATFVVAVASAQWSNEPAEVDPPDVKLTLKPVEDTAVFRAGEPIRLKLLFTSTMPGKYLLTTGSSFRGSPFEGEMHIEPADLVVDPRKALYSGGGFGGSFLSSWAPLTDEPVAIEIDLNEWFRFDHPGFFHLWLTSPRVGRLRGPQEPGDGNVPVNVKSNILDFQIVEADAGWVAQQLQEITEVLDSSQPEQVKSDAARRLRFLNSHGAIQEMARRLAGRHKEFSWEYTQGLAGAKDLEFTRGQLEQQLVSPDSFIDCQFLEILAAFYHAEASKKEESQKTVDAFEVARGRAVNQLKKSLLQKTDAARTFAIQTLLQMTREHVSGELTGFLVDHVNQLNDREQLSLLDGNWEQIRGPEILPLLRAIASRPPRGEWEARELQDKAVQRLLELDPSEGREILVREIRNPRTALKPATLGSLEEAALPDLDAPLIERLRGQLESNGEGPPDITTYLIHRYATKKIYSGAKEVYQKKAGLWACAIQSPLLAYFLRVNEKEGLSLIEQALQPSAATGCHHSLLHDLAELRWTPVLQKVALAHVWDSDSEVAANAVGMLGERGSAEAEGALWKRFEAWSEQWHGRETELRYTPGGPNNPNWPQNVLENNLALALLNGKAWELSGAQQSRVVNLCVTASCRNTVQQGN
jgi:hypothetical protein